MSGRSFAVAAEHEGGCTRPREGTRLEISRRAAPSPSLPSVGRADATPNDGRNARTHHIPVCTSEDLLAVGDFEQPDSHSRVDQCSFHFIRSNIYFIPFPLLAWHQAIDVLEDMLDNGIQEGKQNMFAAKEYVQIYT